MIVLMCDGSSKGNPGPIKVCFYLWDNFSNSSKLKPKYKKTIWRGHGTNNEADWSSINIGLRFLRHKLKNKLKNQDIVIYCDSKVLVDQIASPYMIRNKTITHNAREYILNQIELRKLGCKINVCWIPRAFIDLISRFDIEEDKEEVAKYYP